MGAVAMVLLNVNVWLAAVSGLLVYMAVIFVTGAVRPSEIRSLVRG